MTFVRESKFLDHMFAALKNNPRVFWQDDWELALTRLDELLQVTRKICTAAGLGNWFAREVLNQLLRAAPRDSWWRSRREQPFVRLVKVLSLGGLECFADWDGARCLIPLQGNNKALFDGGTLQQEKIFLPSPSADPHDVEMLLSPVPVMLLLHVDFAAALTDPSLLRGFKSHAVIDDLPIEDLQKHLIQIARDARSQSERHLEDVTTERDQLTLSVQQEQQARADAESQRDRAQSDNERLLQENAQLRSHLREVQPRADEHERLRQENEELRRQVREARPFVGGGQGGRWAQNLVQPISFFAPDEGASQDRAAAALACQQLLARFATIRRASAILHRTQYAALMQATFEGHPRHVHSGCQQVWSNMELAARIGAFLGLH